VLEAAERLNYRPNYFARSLRQSKSLSVGVLAPDLSEGYFTRVMSGVVEELTQKKYFYFTACHDWRRELMEEYSRLLVERAVDGFLLLNTPAEIPVPVPVVAISAHTPLPNVTNIVLNHNRSVEMALEHLHALGHRRIAFMRGPKAIPDSEFRWTGIQAAAKNLGLKLDSALVTRIDQGSWNMKTGYHPMSPEIGYGPMKSLLERTRDFTAIFCFNDIAAIGAIRALSEVGLRVPQDVSVVGFDDIQSAAFCTPSLTTVRQPLNEMGKTGARILLERIANPTAEYPQEVVMEPEFIVRESTGPVRK
jgi:LacI family transcriptional regulator